MQPCDHRKPSYRQLQCSWYNERKILTDGKHNWTAYTIHDPTLDPCNLYCINEKNVFTKFQVANDSTPCKGGTNNMCVGGTCRVSKYHDYLLCFSSFAAIAVLRFNFLAKNHLENSTYCVRTTNRVNLIQKTSLLS